MPIGRADVSPPHWRKSSYSNGSGGACIEVADNLPHTIPVRDSKNPTRTPLLFTPDAWASFVTAVAIGRLAD
ncbi:DUF397 domain-containing protein [Streptomyces coeruleoprunus]|uniref:DUF397 domain-containing protein n=1 Tax=Streptomyces coeruleoprunus TaxID=285563 RepID=A0ABV9XMX2_9ACTN